MYYFKTPKHILKSFFNDCNGYELAQYARNKNTPPRELVSLLESVKTNDMRNYIFELVANNRNTPSYIMMEAAKHKALGPRLGVVQNPKIPLRLLKILAHDRHPLVSKIANKRLANRDYVV